MCGIAGILDLNTQNIDALSLEKMASFIQERGPDHTGYWNEGSAGFVHTRLGIIDLDSRSNQPMTSADGQTIITYNGEIYNYKELQKELSQLGSEFNTSSDTEVLLRAYEVWGLDGLLEWVNGMFAFSVLDKRKNVMILVRDFFGKKPLYYYSNSNEVLFSSDIRSIFSLRKADLTIDYDSIDYYLTELSSPQPKTIWNEISQVPPAHYLEFDLEKKTKSLTKYWSLEKSKNEGLSLEEVTEVTETKLKESIKRRTVADVPVGCFLSGGVDSGLVVALFAQQKSEQVSTFSVGLS